MTYLAKCQNLLNYYKANGFRWNSSQVLEPLSLSMYQVGYCEALFKNEFRLLIGEMTKQKNRANSYAPDEALREWLELKITDLNIYIKLSVSCLWLYLDYYSKTSEAISVDLVIQILRKHTDPMSTLMMNRTVQFESLRQQIEGWKIGSNTQTESNPRTNSNSRGDSSDDTKNDDIKEMAEFICTQFMIEFFNRHYRNLLELRKYEMNGISAKWELKPRQLQILRLLALDQRLGLSNLKDGISNSTYQRLFECNRVMAKRDLNLLLQNSLIKSSGARRGRSSRYLLSPDI